MHYRLIPSIYHSIKVLILGISFSNTLVLFGMDAFPPGTSLETRFTLMQLLIPLYNTQLSAQLQSESALQLANLKHANQKSLLELERTYKQNEMYWTSGAQIIAQLGGQAIPALFDYVLYHGLKKDLHLAQIAKEKAVETYEKAKSDEMNMKTVLQGNNRRAVELIATKIEVQSYLDLEELLNKNPKLKNNPRIQESLSKVYDTKS